MQTTECRLCLLVLVVLEGKDTYLLVLVLERSTVLSISPESFFNWRMLV